jgi:putative transposase
MTDGAFSDDGAFHPLATWDGDAVMKLFRERLLARLVERHAISEDLVRKLLAWRHPGFSAHVGEAIASEDKKAIEDVACHLVRAPLSLKKLVYLDGQKAVLYRSRMNPSLGRNFEAMDPLEWLACMADQIPDTGKHRTHFYGFLRKPPRPPHRPRPVPVGRLAFFAFVVFFFFFPRLTGGSSSSSAGTAVASIPTHPSGGSVPWASKRKREGTDRASRPYFARSKAKLMVRVVMARVMPT